MVLALPAVALTAHDKWRSGEFRGAVILTITGNIGLPTRGESREDIDKYFLLHNVAFSEATQFDAAGLAGLPQVTIEADFPKGEHLTDFTGPLLVDVLRAAGARGDMIMLHGLDDSMIRVPLQPLIDSGAILAVKREGIPFGIGDFGPTQLVFPRLDREDLADMNDDWWIYSIYHIHVN